MVACPKPRPKLLDKRKAKADIAEMDREQRLLCKARSGGRCEVLENRYPNTDRPHRCPRRASQNHHLIGGSGRRNKGASIKFIHRLDVCDRCHEEITNHVLVPVDGTERERAALVRYRRVE